MNDQAKAPEMGDDEEAARLYATNSDCWSPSKEIAFLAGIAHERAKAQAEVGRLREYIAGINLYRMSPQMGEQEIMAIFALASKALQEIDKHKFEDGLSRSLPDTAGAPRPLVASDRSRLNPGRGGEKE